MTYIRLSERCERCAHNYAAHGKNGCTHYVPALGAECGCAEFKLIRRSVREFYAEHLSRLGDAQLDATLEDLLQRTEIPGDEFLWRREAIASEQNKRIS